MTKPADRLRAIRIINEVSSDNPLARDCAALLDECERNIRALIDEETVTVHIGYDNGPGGGNYLFGDAVRTDAPAFVALRATLAKLRGEA